MGETKNTRGRMGACREKGRMEEDVGSMQTHAEEGGKCRKRAAASRDRKGS
jgi:hypothetical protein